MQIFSYSIYLAFFLTKSVVGEYFHKIEPFSFDLGKFEYPLEYNKWGATVSLKKSIKLLPKVKGRYGGLWLSEVSKVKL